MTPAPRRAFTIPLSGRDPLVLGVRTLVMGVINVTPDSFSDAGLALDPTRALDMAQAMEGAGVDLIDVGAESTRPGAGPVDEATELARLRPVLSAMAPHLKVPLSIDTYKAGVAALALDEGVAMVNDISGLEFDPGLGPLLAARGVPLVLMHSRGRPGDAAAHTRYDNVLGDVARELQRRVERAIGFGIGWDHLILDPGLGFGKRSDDSMTALAGVDWLARLGRPLLVGASRKSFMTAATGPLAPAVRDWPTAAAVTAAVLAGAHIVRVHRVAEMVHVVRVADAIRAAAPREM